MWTRKQIDSVTYFINFEYNADSNNVNILMSNFCKLWSKTLNEEELLEIFKDMNPLIEIEDSEIVHQLVDMFDARREDVEWNLVFDDPESELILDLNVPNECVPLQFSVHLELNNDEHYSRTILLPLLAIVKNMENTIEYLCSLIQKKDNEIDEYKLEGAVLSRKAVVTEPFDKNIVNNLLLENLNSKYLDNASELLNESVVSYYNHLNISRITGGNRDTDDVTKITSSTDTTATTSTPEESFESKSVDSSTATSVSSEESNASSKLFIPACNPVKKRRKILKNL